MPARFDPLAYPILYSAPLAISGASAWVEHIPFAGLLIQLLRPTTLVELGTHYGDSYLAFCQAITELRLAARCWAVDTWTGDKHSGPYGPEVTQWLRSRHDPLYSQFSTLLKKDFDSASLDFADGQIDLLHIDGLHTYEAVRHDFDTWIPKVSRRGIVLMHDTQVRGGDFGVWRVWAEVSKGHPHFEFEHGYGLGILAVGPDVPAELVEFFEMANSDPKTIRRFFASLGERMEGLRRLVAVTGVLLRQSTYLQPLAEERGVVWKLPSSFEHAFAQIVPLSESLTNIVQTIAKEHSAMRKMLAANKSKSQTP